MEARNYDLIKQGFERLLAGLEAGDPTLIADQVLQDSTCYLSIEGSSPDGGCHGRQSVVTFLKTIPSADLCHIRPYNFVTRVKGDTAQQSAVIVCVAAKRDETMRYCAFSGIFANTWKKTPEGWKLSCIRFDMTEAKGDFHEYFAGWHFEKNDARWYPGVHLPTIAGEIDSPWKAIPETDERLTEEELILETFSRYAFGIDTLSFENAEQVLSEDLVVNMAPFGFMDKRTFLQTLKLHRKADWYWLHPAKAKRITVSGDIAVAELYRMGGHEQNHTSFAYTEENIDRETACARYSISLKKENGSWKIRRLDYFLGLIACDGAD